MLLRTHATKPSAGGRQTRMRCRKTGVLHPVRFDKRLSNLEEFLSPALTSAIVEPGRAELLRTHRQEICVVFLDLRGFTAFAEKAAPDELLELLNEYYAAVGRIVLAHAGTIERFAGDSVMVFFSDPLPIEQSAEQSLRMAVAAQRAFEPLATSWRRRGYDLGLGCGVAQGMAMVGAIGFAGRQDYAAIGSVTNLAARLCAQARAGEVLADQIVMASAAHSVEASPVGPLSLKGFARPVEAFSVRMQRQRRRGDDRGAEERRVNGRGTVALLRGLPISSG